MKIRLVFFRLVLRTDGQPVSYLYAVQNDTNVPKMFDRKIVCDIKYRMVLTNI